MSVRSITVLLFLLLSLWTAVYGYQRSRPWWYDEDTNVFTPPDANDKTEYAFARLQYPSYGRVADRLWAAHLAGGGSSIAAMPTMYTRITGAASE